MEIRGRGRAAADQRAWAARARRSMRADGARMRRYATGGMGFQSGSR